MDANKRRPLKSTIRADLQKAGTTDEDLCGADFYLQSWGYLSCIEARAERVDLNGKKAGIVTEQEQMSAQKRIRDEKATVAKGRIPAPALPPIQYGAPMPAANGLPSAMAPAADVSPLADFIAV